MSLGIIDSHLATNNIAPFKVDSGCMFISVLNHSLLVEVTVAPSSSSQSSSLLGEGLFHTGPEEAYESALHCIHSCEDRKAIWMEYIHYMRPRGMLSQVGFQRFLDCVQRCILDVDWSRLYQHATITSMDTGILTFTCEDYTFHNEVS